MAAAEAAGQSRAAPSDEGLRAKLAAVEAELAQLGQELQGGQAKRRTMEEERETLGLRVLAAEEVAEQRRVEAIAAVEDLRAAEARLKEYDRLAQENAELREQQAQAEREAKQQATREEASKDAKVELAAAQAKLVELESLVEENRRLRDEVAELRTHEEASAELQRLQVAHRQVRLDADVVTFTRRFFATGKTVAAICHGPQLLIEAGLAKGRNLTSWPSVRTDLVNAGANWMDQEVVIDGNLITSRKPDDLPAFCETILEQLP